MAQNTPHNADEIIRYDSEESVRLLPALIAESEQIASSIIHGDHQQRRAGSGEKFWQFREYQDSDRPQDIDWRQSAKGNRVFVRQKEQQNAQNHLFWCNRSASMDYASEKKLPTKKHMAQVLSLALGLLFAHAGEKIRALEENRAGRGEPAVQKLGQYLLQKNAETLPETNAKIPHHAFLVLCGDFLDPLEIIEKSFSALSLNTHNALVLQVLDPAEINLPFDGHIVFEDMNGEQCAQIDHAGSVRAAYQKKIGQHINAVQNLCQKQGWHHYLHRTDQDMAKTAEDLWLMISRHSETRGG